MAIFVEGRSYEHGQTARIDGEPLGQLVECFAEYFPPKIDDIEHDGGIFFELSLDLPAGKYVLIPQLAISDHVGLGGSIWVGIMSEAGEHIFYERRQINSVLMSRADELLCKFNLSNRTILTVGLGATRLVSKIYSRYMTLHRVQSFDGITRSSFDGPPIFVPPKAIKHVLIGTTSVCNASCPHCPTNKRLLSHLPSGVMSWEMYEKIVLGLKNYGVPVGAMCFGLFAEPFNDPLLTQRLKFAREHLPDMRLEIATNGAAFDASKHSEALGYLNNIAVHVEAVTPKLYNDLMRPLNAARAFPVIAELITVARQRGIGAWITAPIHKTNLSEVPGLKRFAEGLGVPFSAGPIANRCTSSLVYDDIKLAPAASTCRGDITDDLVVDWDGTVLSCCIDFLKRSILGDLREESLAEVMENTARREFHMLMQNGYWSRSDSCRNCVADRLKTVQELIDA